MEILTRIAERLEQGEDEETAALTREAVEGGIAPAEILQRGLIAGMDVIGKQFAAHEIFLPDVLMAARAMVAGMGVIEPLLAAGDVPQRGKVVIGTVEGDLHDIGKNLVGVMLRGAGFEVVDLGHDVSPQTFVDAAEREGAALIGMSALLTTTMPAMERVVSLLNERGLAGRVRVLIGGAPVNEEFARGIGADGYAYDAANAVERARALIAGA